ncbi:MAG: DUF6089 family protein [Bacteroidaceae bacterium]|nr:DUF6089 family protein [Bacteroidaceae bacterium]
MMNVGRNIAHGVKIIITTLVLCLLSETNMLHAQELEYKYELGAMLGTGFYLGDANYSSLYKNSNMAVSLLGRYNLNPRMALKADLAYTTISGNAANLANKYPDIEGQKWDFSNGLIDASCMYEINFWGYGTGRSYKGTHRLVPYIAAGLGFTYAGEDVFTANIPIGFGVKFKVRDRLNLGLDWAMHFSLSDKLDGISEPYSIKSGFLKNKDSYCTTMLYLSYDLCPKYRKCNND